MKSLIAWIQPYGMPAIILLITLEYACFPISSELVLPFAGAFCASKGIPLPLLLIYSCIAGLAGTSLTYAIGRFGGSPLLEKLMHRFPSTQKPIQSSYRTFGNHGNAAVCIARILPICRTYIAFVAGACKQPYFSYVLFSSIGISIWNTVLISIGYYFYNYREPFFIYFNKYKTLILVIGTILLLILLYTNKCHKK